MLSLKFKVVSINGRCLTEQNQSNIKMYSLAITGIIQGLCLENLYIITGISFRTFALDKTTVLILQSFLKLGFSIYSQPYPAHQNFRKTTKYIYFFLLQEQVFFIECNKKFNSLIQTCVVAHCVKCPNSRKYRPEKHRIWTIFTQCYLLQQFL